ncbi:hypothetical protein [Streptomyces spectabilis]|uniref:Uncharacterized protein n=1 Tax=Streptomyces spectabilis TaxID=68270 RepID=A0A7W8EVR6_STRST|nr:hypothetical protein [Streptomyces spectabilis]MBB5104935.1 hypothetical protein [Streptomyces spectabilis]
MGHALLAQPLPQVGDDTVNPDADILVALPEDIGYLLPGTPAAW